jgi:hypothetical protein
MPPISTTLSSRKIPAWDGYDSCDSSSISPLLSHVKDDDSPYFESAKLGPSSPSTRSPFTLTSSVKKGDVTPLLAGAVGTATPGSACRHKELGWSMLDTMADESEEEYDETEETETEPSLPADLRTWAAESGLDENSRFLEHWFGLSNADAVIMTDKLPRPSPWNKFVEESKPAVEAETNGLALRAWAHDAGLAEDSQFLSHWFGLSNAEKKVTEEQLPRPSPWNYFVEAY